MESCKTLVRANPIACFEDVGANERTNPGRRAANNIQRVKTTTGRREAYARVFVGSAGGENFPLQRKVFPLALEGE